MIMDNFMELEKRPAISRTPSTENQSDQAQASFQPPALQLKASAPVYQFQAEEEEMLQAKKVTQLQEIPEEEELQMKKADASPSSLPASVQSQAESHFQSDFSGVQVHANSSKASELGALAYTQGSDIHFAPNAYDPGSASGKSLIGHELTHVVQQSQGRVNPTGEIQGLPLNDDSSLEREADMMGQKFAG